MQLSRATYYRSLKAPTAPKLAVAGSRPSPPRALSVAERQVVRDVLHSPRFVDMPPREVYATLLDEGRYIGHWRTMYRILEHDGESCERRRQRSHQRHAIPRLVARAPRQVWSWDITLLRGLVLREFFYLYVILDIFSRYVVGWMIAECEKDELAEELIATTCARQGVLPEQLVLHADRGSAMRSGKVSRLLERLGVERSHSRPRVSNDNPYSESQFKTLKYHSEFPERFEDISAARRFCGRWFPWYNQQHHHVNLALFTPAQVHLGQVEQVLVARQRTLDGAFAATPERFPHGPPQAKRPPAEAWINRPAEAFTTAADVVGQ